MEGDTKGSGKGAEGSSRKEGVQPVHQGQLVHQGSYPQGVIYGNSQVPLLSYAVAFRVGDYKYHGKYVENGIGKVIFL
uniref:Uncharacterized protein n=1 Tax=Daucus carota subsp. sativus TaxID=79200 RepID=A0A164YGJ5_DAUCS